MTITHTSSSEAGQIYVPFTNLTLFIGVIGSVLVFQSSSNLAAAYGIAVSGGMIISTIMIGFVALLVWRWRPWVAYPRRSTSCSSHPTSSRSDTAAGLRSPSPSFTTLTTWKKGRELVRKQLIAKSVPLDVVIKSLGQRIARARHRCLHDGDDPRRAGGAPA